MAQKETTAQRSCCRMELTRAIKPAMESGGWRESWTSAWCDDRTTLLGTKNGQETVSPITWSSRDVAGMEEASKNLSRGALM